MYGWMEFSTIEVSTCCVHEWRDPKVQCLAACPHRLGEVTLRDFKTAVDRQGSFRYHFKALDPEFGTVKEEVGNYTARKLNTAGIERDVLIITLPGSSQLKLKTVNKQSLFSWIIQCIIKMFKVSLFVHLFVLQSHSKNVFCLFFPQQNSP